jgi:adenylate cyclase
VVDAGWRILGKNHETRLQVSISTLFALLILPALGAVIAFSYHENVNNLSALSQRFIDRARDEAVALSTNLLRPAGATARLVAAFSEASPRFFRDDESNNVLYQALISSDQIDAFYVSFDDGFHRVVTRVDEDRRRSDPRIPANAHWHMSYIDAHAPGVERQRHRTFYETWPVAIGGGYAFATSVDITALQHYRAARQTDALAIGDPFINPDTGYPVVALGYPIHEGGGFVGVVSAQLTLQELSTVLEKHKISRHSITVIADQHGDVIAHPDPAKAVQRRDGELHLTNLAKLQEPQIVEAVRLRAANAGQDRFRYEAGDDAREYVALFSEFPTGAASQWQVLVVTPTDDFEDELKRTNRKLIWLMLALALVESGLIYVMSRRISRPIEIVSEKIEGIRSLSFGQDMPRGSHIREIAQLQRATALLDNALRSFAAFAPVGIVRGLIESGRPLAPGVEQRFMTVLFSDVEGFTSIAEQLSPQELSDQTSLYFETVTSAIVEASGTIDKFIGDSVMAFWGAPIEVRDHVFLACVAALHAHHRMLRLNARWAGEGQRQMRVRFGIHCDTVVVGNVGSAARLSYTVMGDGVNIASRIEGLNKQFGTSICISDDVYKQVAGRVIVRPLERVAVKGRRGELMVHELLGIADSEDPELRAP